MNKCQCHDILFIYTPQLYTLWFSFVPQLYHASATHAIIMVRAQRWKQCTAISASVRMLLLEPCVKQVHFQLLV